MQTVSSVHFYNLIPSSPEGDKHFNNLLTLHTGVGVCHTHRKIRPE